MEWKAVIFDLDGVICFTDEYHYQAWKAVADEIGAPFDREVNQQLLGVSRMDSLEIILKNAPRQYSAEEKLALAERKNELYRQMLWQMTPADLSKETRDMLEILRGRGYKLAIGSSSRNAPFILERLGLKGFFDAVADGNCITRSKPDPEVFLKAAQMLGLEPGDCLVVEDAVAGVQAAHSGGMRAACVGDAAKKQAGDYNLGRISELLQLLPETRFEQIAKALEPRLFHRKVSGQIPPHELRTGDAVTVDFGEHLAGYSEFTLNYTGKRPDAPVWLQVRFAERLCELEEKTEDYHGFVSAAWVQQEQLHVDCLPATISLPRRYAFRYMQVQILALSGNCALHVAETACDAVTSADEDALEPWHDTKIAEKLDKVSCLTLRDCMQEVFEDGPKRDRRLWLGDLRIQALVNYHTYRNNALVKRCLYLFATCQLPDGHIPSSLFVQPRVESEGGWSFDYSLLYVPTLWDYWEATGDTETVRDLWDVAWKQIELAREQFDENHLIIAPEEMGWCFIDWSFMLDRQASAQGVYLYCLRSATKLAELLQDEGRKAAAEQEYAAKKGAAHSAFLDTETGICVSGKSCQLSWASQIWLTLGGALEASEALTALEKIKEEQEAVTPATPYLMHHYVQALIQVRAFDAARQVLLDYWGGMLKQRADTFWEMYDPNDPKLAPYGGTIVNSYCHAWSCGPAYFIRKYGSQLGFCKGYNKDEKRNDCFESRA